MPDLIAGLIFYNDTPELLERSMKAIKASNMDIIAIDGAFQEFPKAEWQKYYSTDGCIDVAKKYADLYVPAPKWGFEDQAAKRNIYFRMIPTGDYCFVLDGDEFLSPCDIDFNAMNEDVYIVNCQLSENGRWTNYVRIYKVYPDLAYQHQHCRLYRMHNHYPEKGIQSGTIVQAHGNKFPTLKDKSGREVWFTHSPELRSPARQKQDDIYMANRKERQFINKIHAERDGK